jgi:flagellar hook-associated protein 1 FlgK
MSLFSLGLSGLNAAQAGMTVGGHNIDNSGTEGYNRQRVMTSTAGATGTAQGYFGRGVQVDTVQRQYNSFLYQQLVGAQSTGASTSTFLNQISQVDNMLGDNTTGISPALAAFFTSLNAVASSPADAATRQDLIGKSQSLVSQINSAYQDLQTQRDGLNSQISSGVDQVNSYLDQINNLNQQIVVARGVAGGNAPNDLMDQRDLLVSQLSQVVGIRYNEQGDTVNISLASGQALLSGKTVYKLQAVPSAADPGRMAVAYTIPSGPNGATMAVEMSDSRVTDGTLGGLLQFRTQSLDTLQNKLGQMAVGLAMAVNEQHKKGVDLHGATGTDFFSLGTAGAIGGAKNTGSGNITAAYTDASQLTTSDYSIKFDGTDYTVTRVSDGASVYTGDGITTPMEFDGLTITLSGAPQPGDTWTLQPTRNAARDLSQAITDPGKIAASSNGTDSGSANGNNALELAKLQTSKTLNGGAISLTEAYSQIVNTVGQQASAASANDKAQTSVISQRQNDQQSVSGVNLNEEYVNLSLYTQQYQAASKLIEVAGTVFDSLLGIR